MSIHNLQSRVKLNKIGKRDNKKSLKKHAVSNILALKSTLYASVLRMPSWPLRHLDCDVNVHLSRDLNKSNKFGQMQALTNDNYSEIKCIPH